MNNIFKKITAAVILMASFLSFFSSCSATHETNESAALTSSAAEVSNSEETTVLEPDLPKMDFEGYNCRFLVRDKNHMVFAAKDIYAEGETGDVINDAVYRRNVKIEDKYNFEITQNAVTNPGTFIQKLITANEDAYDVLIEASVFSVTLAARKMLVDLKTVPYLDFTKPWWDASMTKELSIGNKLYCNMGELIISDNDGTWAVLFNKSMIKDYNMKSPYELVKSKTWTIDKMHEMSKTVAKDMNNDDKMSVLDDQFGFATEPYNISFMISGAGERIAAKGEDDYPVLTMNTPRYISAYEKALEFSTDYSTTVDAAKIKETADPYYGGIIPAFNEGRVLFYMTAMAVVPQFRNMEQDFGILPIPKLDEEQNNYYTTMSVINNGAIFIPVTYSDLGRIGFILEALSAESLYTLTPAYYDVSLKTKFTRDDESSEMLDILFKNRIVDIGATYNFGGLFEMIVTGNTNFSSEYKKREKIALTEIEKLKK